MTCFTPPPTPHADIRLDGHRESWPIRSKRFRGWLRRRYCQATGGTASAAEIRSALDLLEARAQFDAAKRAVHVRIAEHAGHAGHIYLDLANEQWRAGWMARPVRFRRPLGMLPLCASIRPRTSRAPAFQSQQSFWQRDLSLSYDSIGVVNA